MYPKEISSRIAILKKRDDLLPLLIDFRRDKKNPFGCANPAPGCVRLSHPDKLGDRSTVPGDDDFLLSSASTSFDKCVFASKIGTMNIRNLSFILLFWSVPFIC